MPQFNPADYIDVHARITRFWEENPNGAIVTDMISDPTQFDTCVVRASVYRDRSEPYPTATGIAGEWKGGGNASNLCWHENAETSAIGRAMANMGYAVSQNRASREEMEKLTRHEGDSFQAAPQQQPTQFQPRPQPAPRTSFGHGGTSDAATEKQMNMIQSLGGVMQDGMTKKQASSYIDELMQEKGMEPREAPQQQQQRQPFTGTISNPDAPATDAQKNFLKNEWKKQYGDLGDEGLVSFIAQQTSAPAQELTKGEASRLINGIKDGTLKPSPPF